MLLLSGTSPHSVPFTEKLFCIGLSSRSLKPYNKSLLKESREDNQVNSCWGYLKGEYCFAESFSFPNSFPGSSVGKESTGNAGDPGSIPRLGRSPGEGIGYPLQYSWASLVAQLTNNLPAMWEAWVWSLGWEDPLEKGKATHSSILAWRIPWTWGHKELDTTEGLSLALFHFCLRYKGFVNKISHSLYTNK